MNTNIKMAKVITVTTARNTQGRLKEQEDYFLERLVLDEKYHYAERMCRLDFGI